MFSNTSSLLGDKVHRRKHDFSVSLNCNYEDWETTKYALTMMRCAQLTYASLTLLVVRQLMKKSTAAVAVLSFVRTVRPQVGGGVMSKRASCWTYVIFMSGNEGSILGFLHKHT